MKLEDIVSWIDKTLKASAFEDVSNNGLQVGRREGKGEKAEIKTVAFAVDASLRAVEAAEKAGAEMLFVHHGISWGGGIRRLTGGVFDVVGAAREANLAICACHLPLDAHPVLGNNAQLARLLGLKKVRPAFSYHGSRIGLIGEYSGKCLKERIEECLNPRSLQTFGCSGVETQRRSKVVVGLCSGGAGEFAEEAKRLGCDVYLTGEANWGNVIAAENCGMKMICAGHYETEIFGVRAVAREMKKALRLDTVDLTETLRPKG